MTRAERAALLNFADWYRGKAGQRPYVYGQVWLACDLLPRIADEPEGRAAIAESISWSWTNGPRARGVK